MPCLSMQVNGIQRHGPLVEILILPSRPVLEIIHAQGGQPPKPLKIAAMIDTGASTTVIKTGLPDALGLKQRGEITISTPSCTAVKCRTFDASIIFPLINAMLQTVTLTEAPLEGQGIGCLIGRDILAKCVFIYEGFSNRFTLAI